MSSKTCSAWVRPEPDMPVITTTSGTRAALSAARIRWPASDMGPPSVVLLASIRQAWQARQNRDSTAGLP